MLVFFNITLNPFYIWVVDKFEEGAVLEDSSDNLDGNGHGVKPTIIINGLILFIELYNELG